MLNQFIDLPKYKRVDHVGFPQLEGTLQEALKQFYDLGFFHFFSVDENVIFSETSTLRSTVMSDYSGEIKFPMFEPV